MITWVALGAHASAADGTSDGRRSRFAREQEFARLTADEARIAREIEVLVEAEARVGKARSELATIQLNEQEALGLLSQVKREQAGGSDPNRPSRARSDLVGRLDAAYQPVWDLATPGRDGAEAGDLFRRLRATSGFDGRSLSGTATSRAIFQGDSEVIRKLGAQELSAAFQQNVQAASGHIDRWASAVAALKTERTSALEAVRAKLKELDKQLASEMNADQLLIYAIYVMIACLAVLFFAIRLFPEKIQETIIENRLLIEVVSMAFLLLTIIILATGNRLQTEALGTLLGTVAGYIFGKREGAFQPRHATQNTGGAAVRAAEPNP